MTKLSLICPCCGLMGDNNNFQMLGQQKVLCRNCRAVLKIALKCPACDAFISIPSMPLIPGNIIYKFLNKSIFRLAIREGIQCPVCDYKAGIDHFTRVVVFKEEYSVIL